MGYGHLNESITAHVSNSCNACLTIIVWAENLWADASPKKQMGLEGRIPLLGRPKSKTVP